MGGGASGWLGRRGPGARIRGVRQAAAKTGPFPRNAGVTGEGARGPWAVDAWTRVCLLERR